MREEFNTRNGPPVVSDQPQFRKEFRQLIHILAGAIVQRWKREQASATPIASNDKP